MFADDRKISGKSREVYLSSFLLVCLRLKKERHQGVDIPIRVPRVKLQRNHFGRGAEEGKKQGLQNTLDRGRRPNLC